MVSPRRCLLPSKQEADNCKPLFLSTYDPTPCGIATFTRDLADAVDLAASEPVSAVAAIRSEPARAESRRVVHVVNNSDKDAYRRAAYFCNDYPCSVISIQHEYGLYPGECGEAILDFARCCTKPLVTTLHTLSPEPAASERQVLRELAHLSQRVIVMAHMAVDILEAVYGVSPQEVRHIPHGVHEFTCHESILCRHRMSIQGGPVLLTFGLLGPGKGIEYMIEALPKILRRYPEAVYLVIGRTHPVLKAQEGERYRQRLRERADGLGISEHVSFDDRFLSLGELLLYLHSADVIVTPYVAKNQITSGVLAYAISGSKAVVSTPYLYAQEIASHDAALLAEFRDSSSLAQKVLRVLDTPTLRMRLQQQAAELGSEMVWRNVGKQYHALFGAVAIGEEATRGADGLLAQEHMSASRERSV